MNSIFYVLGICGLFLVPGVAFGADLVKFPDGPAAWAVEIGAPATGTVSAKHIVKMDVVQDDQKRRSNLTWSNGETTERWEIPAQNLILGQDPKGQPFATLGGGLSGRVLAIPFFRSSFEWLDAKYLLEKGPITYQGKLCFHYGGVVAQPDLLSETGLSAPGKCEAWIESQTLLPVALSNAYGVATFKFRKEPPSPLTLPVQFQGVYDRYEQSMGIVQPNSAP